MSKRTTAVLVGVCLGAFLLACDRPGEGIGPDFEQIPSANVPIAVNPSMPVATRSAAAVSSSSASVASASSGSASGSAAGSAQAAPGAPSGSASAKPAGKVFDCGDKGKPDCPMQKWMKGVAGGAVASGDNERLARAFNAMSKAPPGFGDWASICATGAAKAQAGDFDGAKAQCKVCHSKYQSRYHASLRDLKWP